MISTQVLALLGIPCQRVLLKLELVVEELVDVEILLPEAMLSGFRRPAAPRLEAVAHDAARPSCGVDERDVDVVFAERPCRREAGPAGTDDNYFLARRRLQCVADGCEPCDDHQMGVHCAQRSYLSREASKRRMQSRTTAGAAHAGKHTVYDNFF